MLDGSIANIALPSISRALDADPARTIWVVNAYQLTVTVCLLPLSSLGDILGYKRVYRVGLATFLIGSILCALATNLPMLVAARVLQGVGGAGIMSVNTALVRFIYPPTKLGRGIGLNALVVGVTIAVGPSLGALILAVGSWPWLFAVNIPVACAALAISRTALPETPAQPREFDYPSAVLSAIVFGLFVLGVDALGHAPLRLAGAAGLVAAIELGWLLVRRQRGRLAPLVPSGPVRQPRLHAGGGHVVLLVHDPDAGVRVAAVLSGIPARAQPPGDRAADHTVAADGGRDGAGVGTPLRAVSGLDPGRRGPDLPLLAG